MSALGALLEQEAQLPLLTPPTSLVIRPVPRPSPAVPPCLQDVAHILLLGGASLPVPALLDSSSWLLALPDVT